MSPRFGRCVSQIGELPEEIGPAVLIDGDVLDVGQREICLPQAIGDRLGREAGPMLYAAESLLFCCRNELAVANERGGGIAVEGIEAENDHPFASCTVTPAVFRPTSRFLCQRQESVIMVASSERSVDQPSNSRACFASATRIGGSPRRRTTSRDLISRPVMARAVSTTSQAYAPCPLARFTTIVRRRRDAGVQEHARRRGRRCAHNRE